MSDLSHQFDAYAPGGPLYAPPKSRPTAPLTGVPKESRMSPSPILDAAGVERLVQGAVRSAFAAHDKPAPVFAVMKNRPRRPSISRAIKALSAGSWKGAELERDLSQCAADILGYKEADDDTSRSLVVSTTVAEARAVLEATGIKTPSSEAAEYAIKSIGEGTSTLTATGLAGTGMAVEFVLDSMGLPLVAPPVLTAIPSVVTIPIGSNIAELPRVAAGAIQLPGENTGATLTDIVPALNEHKIAKPVHLMQMSEEAYADIGAPGVDVLMQRVMAAEILSWIDYQYLEGSGVTPSMKGIRNQSNLATSTWTAATNGSTPGGDDLVTMFLGLVSANVFPTDAIANPRTWLHFATLKDSQGRYIFPNIFDREPVIDASLPHRIGSLFGVLLWSTSAVPLTDVQGTSSTATHIIYGDFRNVVVLQRQGVQLFASRDYALNQDAVVIRATIRAGVGLRNPGALSVATGII